MKTRIFVTFLTALVSSLSIAAAQSTAFTYQGHLTQAGEPASGLYEMQFTLFDAVTNGTAVGVPVSVAPVTVSNGLFTVTLDFGAAAFMGSNRWLEITVNLFGSDMVATMLQPRQPITPTPYALHAGNAANLMSFVDVPMDIKVNGQRLLRLEATGNSPNIIGGVEQNVVAPGVIAATIGGGGFAGGPNEIEASYSTIGGGGANKVQAGANAATIAGGLENRVGSGANDATIAGGNGNQIDMNASAATIGGGIQHIIRPGAHFATIGGGFVNIISNNSLNATISGGGQNRISSDAANATLAGGYGNSIGVGAFGSTIAGGTSNTIQTYSGWATIAGGVGHIIQTNAPAATIGGGSGHIIQTDSDLSTISGGESNTVQTYAGWAMVGGGRNNTIQTDADLATIGGGDHNTIRAESDYATIAGGKDNESSGGYATVPGGFGNIATNNAFAAGTRARANHTGAFVWGDSTNADIASTNDNAMTFRASGGVRIFSDSTASAGVFLAPGGIAWGILSDRNAKKNVAPVDGCTVLDKLSRVPVQRWNYKWEADDAVPHLGPMAQDFKAAFYPGRDDKCITTQEVDGVALAAIQGLNQKLEQEVKAKNSEIEALKRSLAELKEMVGRLAAQQNEGAR